jgi:pseudouridine-5'-phosphate glycosidase
MMRPEARGHLRIADEVQTALDVGRPVVALESTLIAHGLPYPTNLEVAQRLERLVRQHGAVPATVAIRRGKLCVGLSDEDLGFLAEAPHVRKVSVRDLPVVVAQAGDGATTVATTALLAHQAGIQVFATGGIGGVHRGEIADVSADLTVLAATPLIVVCAGAKAILDLPATLEWLETAGVPVLGWETPEFPAFYSRASGLPVDTSVASAVEVAEVFRAQREVGLPQGLLVAVPVPVEAELPRPEMEAAIEAALTAAAAQGVRGRALTPFLLGQIVAQTGGESLRANIALLENNVHRAVQIAGALGGITNPWTG